MFDPRDQRIADLESRLTAKDAEIADLKSKVEDLTKLVLTLKEQLDRNSSNSNKPPSSDTPAQKDERRGKGASEGKRGGQQRADSADHCAVQLSLLKHALEHATGQGGAMFSKSSNARRDIRAACKRAGIAPCSPNDLRRTTATWLVGQGVPPQIIGQGVMGHRDGRMVELVYGRMTTQSAKKLLALRAALRQRKVGQ